MALFTPAVRRKKNLRMALIGVSGGGKTLSALYIAYGMTGDWSKIAVIDSEHGGAELYSQRGDLNVGQFLHMNACPPFSPQAYIEYIAEGAKIVGPDGVLIIDSMSHLWKGEGGVLDIKERIVATTKKNEFTAWNDAGKEQDSLIGAILAANCHVIATIRVKQDYAMIENERGKTEPRKVGLAPVQRDDVEYEFDTVINIARNHVATVSKDRTYLDSFAGIITPEIGEGLRAWLNEGIEPKKCSVCGKVIFPTKNKSADDIAEGTAKHMGKPACVNCFKEWQKENEAAEAVSEQIAQ